MLIEIPVPVAELFDKISILEIKLENIPDLGKRSHAEKELSILRGIAEAHGLAIFLSSDLYRQLKEVNQALWDVCDLRRQFEDAKCFGEEFVAQSRHEYKTNDRRAVVKAEINRQFDSEIVEVKSYARFSHEEEG